MAVQLQPCDPNRLEGLSAARNRNVDLGQPEVQESQRALRRPQSFHCLSRSISSGDTVISDKDSVYNADVVQSFEDLVPLEGTIYYPTKARDGHRTENIPPRHQNAQSSTQSHSRWPPVTLEPIFEVRTRSSLTRAASLNEVTSGSFGSLRTGAQRSIPNERISTTASQLLLTTGSASRPRSLSLNDLDCCPKSDVLQALAVSRKLHATSSSSITSSRWFGINSRHPASPLRPLHAPPHRTPTPPGLPSFGTLEAQAVRLDSSSYVSRAINYISQCFQRRPGKKNETVHNRGHGVSTASTNQNRSSRSFVRDNLRGALGANRLTNIPQHCDTARIPLPRGIRATNTVGALTQAEDGTPIRGRWDYRANGHGIGNRALDLHPLARATRISSIDAVLEDVEKTSAANHGLSHAGVDMSLPDNDGHPLPTA